MEIKKCPNCNNEVTNDENICPYCGTKMNGEVDFTKKTSLSDGTLKKGLLVLLLAVLGIIITLTYRAWLGTPIYAIAAIVAIIHLRNEHEADGGAFGEFIKDCLHSKDIGIKIMTIVALILPVILVYGLYAYIYVDTEREVEAYFNYIHPLIFK